MPPIDQQVPGSFCWFELGTTDLPAAKQFYQTLFGWGVTDEPIGPNEVYSFFTVEGRHAAAGYALPEAERAKGWPARWIVYIQVENVDATAAKATAAGGTLLAAPLDVMDAGRMALVQDPTGATFALWQKKRHGGVGVVQELGTAVWADLSTPDQARAGRFYSDLLGWKMSAGKNKPEAVPGQYFHIVNGDDFIGGIPPPDHRDPHTPAHWLVYFSVADCRASLAHATALGAKVLFGPMTIEDTRTFATLADPQGAAFAIVDQARK